MPIEILRSSPDLESFRNQVNRLINDVNDLMIVPYGEITIDSNATATALTTEDVWYQITPNWTSNVTPVGVTIDVAAGTMTINRNAMYAMMATIAFTSTDGTELVEFGMFSDGVLVPDHFALTWIDTEIYPNTISITGIDPLVVGNVIDLRTRCTTAAGKALTVVGANFSIFGIARLP